MKINRKALAPAAKLTRNAALIAAALMAMTPSFADTSQWMTDCGTLQTATNAATAANVSKQADANPYLINVAAKDVGGPNQSQIASGSAAGNFNCNGTVDGAFNSMLSSVGSMFGMDLGSLFGSIAGSQAGNLCGSVNKAIGGTVGGVNLQCPTTSIPGFNGGCGAAANAFTSTASTAASTPTSTAASNVACWFSGSC